MKSHPTKIALMLAWIVCSCCSPKATDAEPAGTILPVHIVDISGPRPTIAYSINGKAASSMIHSNANMYIQLSPENAVYFGIEDMKETGRFGITEPGKTNTSYTGIIQKMEMGHLSYDSIRVSVFSKFPPDKEGFGMLGLPWIKENHIILNYQNNTVAIRPNRHQQDSIKACLMEMGYNALPMIEEDDQYFTEASINGVKGKFSINTVSRLSIDSLFAVRAGIEPAGVAGTYGGPGGRTGYIYDTKEKLKIQIGTIEITAEGFIEDKYAYANAQRPENAEENIGGSLSGDFMIENKAVIDFGNLTLYLKPLPPF